MSYPRKVEQQKSLHRQSTKLDKIRKTKASAAGIAYLKGSGVFMPPVLKKGERSVLRKMWDIMSPWRSKKSIAASEKLAEDLEAEKRRAKRKPQKV